MGRRCRLLLLWALLGLLHPGAPEAQSEQHTYKNVKLLQISMRPTASVQISSKEEESPKDRDHSKSADEAESKEEEKTLNDLVDVLQNMVQDVPTMKAQHPVHTIPLPTAPLATEQPVAIPLPTVPLATEPPVAMTTVLEASQSETVDTVWVTLKPTPKAAEATETKATESVAVAHQISPASPTPILEIENVTSQSALLHTDQATTEKTLVSVSLVIEKATTQKSTKTFDQLTNGALSNLEQSLENVKKLNGILDTFTKKPAEQKSEEAKAHKKKPTAEELLEMIEKLIETLKSTPSFVKEDRNLYKYIETAETYIKEALELTAKAEKQLQQENPALPSTHSPARATEMSFEPVQRLAPLPVPTEIAPSISPLPAPLSKKAEDVQVEMGKLKAFINLLYGFSPHLTSYTKNTAHKKVAEDIVERALAVLHAIKSVFCGSNEAQSKQALKELLKEDMALVNQAMKTKRVS